MDKDRPSRKDVDDYASKILVSFGLMNAAALAAALSDQTDFAIKPFAIGLLLCIFAQIVWYIDIALEEALGDNVLDNENLSDCFWLVLSLLVVVPGAVSGGCIIYGCFSILGLSQGSSFFFAGLMSFVPIVILFAIAIGHGIKEGKINADNEE